MAHAVRAHGPRQAASSAASDSLGAIQLNFDMSSVRVAPSPVEGKGVFATEPARGGDTVLVLDTSRVIDEEHPLRPEEDEHEDHLAFLAGGKVVLLPEPERHLNHSCDPNAYVHTVEMEVRVVARRPIQAGEEVTIDYLINTHGGSSWRCRCGTDRCRGQLETSFFELPIRFQREYLSILEAWFVEEHREEFEQLTERLGNFECR